MDGRNGITIKLTKNYEIDSDEYQYIVRKYSHLSKKTGEEVWKAKAYFQRLDQCIQWFLDLKEREAVHDLTTIKEVAESVQNQVDSLNLMLEQSRKGVNLEGIG